MRCDTLRLTCDRGPSSAAVVNSQRCVTNDQMPRSFDLQSTPEARTRRTQWALITAWSVTLAGLFIAVEVAPAARMIFPDGPMGLGQALRMVMGVRAPILLLSPLIAWCALIACPGRVKWPIAIAMALGAAALTSIVTVLSEEPLSRVLADDAARSISEHQIPELIEFEVPADGDAPTELVNEFSDAEVVFIRPHEGEPRFWHFFSHFIEYLAFFGAVLVVAMALRSGELERSRAVAESELVASENRFLRAQLDPHFIFNALNGVQVLTREDPDRAAALVQQLASLLRASLSDASQPIIRLENELAVLENYTAIERIRFGDRIRFVIEVAQDIGHCTLPSFSLQPLVENALRHGPGTLPEGGEIVVRASTARGELIVVVEDDGPGFPNDRSDGYGLGNLRDRLERHYGEAASMVTKTSESGGAAVALRIPQPSPGADGDA